MCVCVRVCVCVCVSVAHFTGIVLWRGGVFIFVQKVDLKKIAVFLIVLPLNAQVENSFVGMLHHTSLGRRGKTSLCILLPKTLSLQL
jgi:hypothetical protein